MKGKKCGNKVKKKMLVSPLTSFPLSLQKSVKQAEIRIQGYHMESIK